MLDSLFFNVADLKTGNFIKKGLQHRRFPVKFAKFWRISTNFFFCTDLLKVLKGKNENPERHELTSSWYLAYILVLLLVPLSMYLPAWLNIISTLRNAEATVKAFPQNPWKNPWHSLLLVKLRAKDLTT